MYNVRKGRRLYKKVRSWYVICNCGVLLKEISTQNGSHYKPTFTFVWWPSGKYIQTMTRCSDEADWSDEFARNKKGQIICWPAKCCEIASKWLWEWRGTFTSYRWRSVADPLQELAAAVETTATPSVSTRAMTGITRQFWGWCLFKRIQHVVSHYEFPYHRRRREKRIDVD